MSTRIRNAKGELLEEGWQRQVIQLARLGGWRFFHAPSNRPGRRTGRPQSMDPECVGFPDLVLVRGSETLFRELKTDKGRLGPGQQDWLDVLAAAGHDAAVWRPRDLDVVRERLLRPRPRRPRSEP